MDIVLFFQGDEIYRITLPNNTLKASFELDAKCDIYQDVKISLPIIKTIELNEIQIEN